MIEIDKFKSLKYSTDVGDCKYRAPGAIICANGLACRNCGWNPEVEEKRKAEIHAKLREGRYGDQ